jgi:hypothetical protein
MLQLGAVRPPVKKGNSQAHPGVSPHNPLTHRNIGYQPLPKPLGLPSYRCALGDHFKDMGGHITDSGKVVMDVLGDSGAVQDGELQGPVADQMVRALWKNTPHFCYHTGDVVYFTGVHNDDCPQFYSP